MMFTYWFSSLLVVSLAQYMRYILTTSIKMKKKSILTQNKCHTKALGTQDLLGDLNSSFLHMQI